MKLVAIDEAKAERIVRLLGPAIAQLQKQGKDNQAAELIDLRRYVRAKIEMGPELRDASQRGRLGGCSKSAIKRDASRINGQKGGPPGKYYARLLIAPPGDVPARVLDCIFENRQIRDEWLDGPGKRIALLTTDRDFRIAQMQDPPTLAMGNARRQRELEDDELHSTFERCADVMEYCDVCQALTERRFLTFVAENHLCHRCHAMIRFLRK